MNNAKEVRRRELMAYIQNRNPDVIFQLYFQLFHSMPPAGTLASAMVEEIVSREFPDEQ